MTGPARTFISILRTQLDTEMQLEEKQVRVQRKPITAATKDRVPFLQIEPGICIIIHLARTLPIRAMLPYELWNFI